MTAIMGGYIKNVVRLVSPGSARSNWDANKPCTLLVPKKLLQLVSAHSYYPPAMPRHKTWAVWIATIGLKKKLEDAELGAASRALAPR